MIPLFFLLLSCTPGPPPYTVTCDSVDCPTADVVRRYEGSQIRSVRCTWYEPEFLRIEFEAWYGECFEEVGRE